MCGIAGSVNYKLDISSLTKDLFHRGPDEQSSFFDGVVTFHHHRLSILDITGGKQPMHLGPLTIIFNGEIYNHSDIRKKYSLLCNTSSDTETILHAFLKLGPSCLDEMDGMFAFTIYDRRTQQLFLARDRSGKKPLYYYLKNESFVFASELNALQKQVKDELSHENLEQFFKFGALHGETTPYKYTKELLPGNYAIYDIASSKFSSSRWWNILDFYKKTSQLSENEALSEIDSKLHLAVKRRIESSDLEVGSFLSGGIDSGLVTAIASQYKSALQTFTVSFPGVYDEAPLAKIVAEKYNTRHQEICISFDHLQDDIEKILSNYGEPFYDDSAIPSYYVSKAAKEHLTVILNGDGSDEIFGGYRRYIPFSKIDFFKNSFSRIYLSRLLKQIIPFSKQKQSIINYLYRLADLSSKNKLDVYFSASTDLFCGYESSLYSDPDKYNVELQSDFDLINGQSFSGLQKIMCLDFNAILPDILLPKMDIATMSCSLEGRSPFLSREILEFGPTLSDTFKVRGKTTKYLLRKLAIKYLPQEIVNQPKRGFEVPLVNWVDNDLKQIIFDYLFDQSSYVNNYVKKEFIYKLADKKINISEEKRAKLLYSLFAFNVWYNKCVTSNG